MDEADQLSEMKAKSAYGNLDRPRHFCQINSVVKKETKNNSPAQLCPSVKDLCSLLDDMVPNARSIRAMYPGMFLELFQQESIKIHKRC